MAAPILDTMADLLDHLLDYGQGGGVDLEVRDVRRASQMAYRDLMLGNEWKAYLARGRIYLNAAYSTGTLAYTHTGGAYERMVTLTGGTWPTWAIYGTMLISGVRYKVEDRKSNSVLTLTSDSNPAANVASLTAYTLYQNIYPLPGDFKKLVRLFYEDSQGSLDDISLSNWLGMDQNGATSGDPYFFSIAGSPDLYGQLAIHLYPYPDEAKTIDFIYWRNARQLYYTGLENEARVGTVTGTAGMNTLAGTSTLFHSKMIGSVIRLSRNTTVLPSGLSGLNPFQEQKVITGVTSTTAITLDSTLQYTYSAVKYTVSDPLDADAALLMALYRGAELQLDYLRHPERVMQRKVLYASAFREAMERDQRVLDDSWPNEPCWCFGGTIVTETTSTTEDDETETTVEGAVDILFILSASSTIANTATETAFTTVGSGSLTLAANTWDIYERITIHIAGGYGTNASTAGTLTLKLKIGTAHTFTFAITPPDAQVDKGWWIDATLDRQTLTTVAAQGKLTYNVEGTSELQGVDAPENGVVTIDAATPQIISLTADWESVDTDNTITCDQFMVEKASA